jgi:hypothetical protein
MPDFKLDPDHVPTAAEAAAALRHVLAGTCTPGPAGLEGVAAAGDRLTVRPTTGAARSAYLARLRGLGGHYAGFPVDVARPTAPARRRKGAP